MIKVLRNPTDETTALTSCHGYIETTYQDLVDRFGEPTFEDHDPREKVNAEWVLEIDGKIVTIYNYFFRRVPMGKHDWHVGGHDSSILYLFCKYEIGNGEPRPYFT
jgi:hypothetical protein